MNRVTKTSTEVLSQINEKFSKSKTNKKIATSCLQLCEEWALIKESALEDFSKYQAKRSCRKYIKENLKEEVAGSMRNLKYAKRIPKRSVHKFTKFILLCALMGVVYLMYSDAFVISEAWGGELTKVMFGFAILFVFLFYFIKKSNSSI